MKFPSCFFIVVCFFPLALLAGQQQSPRVTGSQANAGQQQSPLLGSQANAGQQQSPLLGSQANAGQQQSPRVTGSQANAGQQQSPQLGSQATAGSTSQLEVGKTISREMRGGESQEYEFILAAGKYAHIEINQVSIDIAFAAIAPGGQQIFEGNLTYPGELEKVSVISDAAGVYRLRVWPVHNTASGKYEISFTEVQEAGEVHKHRVAAEHAMAAGMAMYHNQSAEAKRNATAKYAEALEHWRAAGDPQNESIVLSTMGNFYNELGEKQKALELANQALALAHAQGDPAGEGWAFDALGAIYDNFGDKKLALEALRQALPLLRSTHHRHGETRVLNALGMSLYALGQKEEAVRYFQQAAELCHQVNNLGGEASLLNNIAFYYIDLGEHGKALELQNTSLEIRRRIHDRSGQGVILNNIGTSYSNLSEYQKAMDAYTEALNIARELGQEQDEALRLNNLAWLYSAVGDDESAIKYYTQSVAIFRRIKDDWRLAQALTNLGSSYAGIHDYARALELYDEALLLHRKGGNQGGLANTLNNAAFAYNKLGEREKALKHYLEAVSILRASPEPRLLVSALHNLGTLSRQMGDRQKANDYLRESWQINRSIGNRRGEAESLGAIARLELDAGDLESARKHCDEALAIFDSLRSRITNPKLRLWFSQASRRVQEINLDALLRSHRAQPGAGYDAAIVAGMEKARARSLVELLGESQARLHEGVDPALLDQEVALRRAIAGKAQAQERLLAGKPTEEQAAQAARELDRLTREYDQLQSAIREKSPAYAALTMPLPLTLSDIQANVLDEDTLLLEYALGEEKGFLVAVTPHSLDVFELPGREAIEAAARRVYDLLTAHNLTVPGETLQQRTLRLRRARAEYPLAAADLSRMVLGPAASRLGTKRLLIVAEGALQYVPFSALPEPVAGPRGKSQPLIVRHEVVTAPSASVLAVIRNGASQRPAAEKLLAVVADPVFDAVDPRIARHEDPRIAQHEDPRIARHEAPRIARHEKDASAAHPANASSDITRSGAESGMPSFERLRFSRREAEQIARLVEGPGKFTALDFAASRATATSPDLAQYRIIHFATHGIINNQHPELSGLVLSLVDEKGGPVDGFLRLYDVYNLKLAADLVVLSACQTALGKEMKGEGLVGLTRGFMYAGVPRVIASLWRIDDRATSDFMASFYQAMLARHERPAAALRSAQLATWKMQGWDSPYYWAAFTLQGEWK
jgi:CHAT domain-containing protein/Tfp pilus assembly protein PilF